MNTFWVPALGGMEYTMPGEVLPLWLEADHPGTYWGHSGQFSGVDFAQMFFTVRVLSASGFAAWQRGAAAEPALTMAGYQGLLAFGTTGQHTYGRYPAATFPSQANGFSLIGGRYVAADGSGTAMAKGA